MTELQIAIGHLKETISVENVLLGKLEKEQKDKIPVFPLRFLAVPDSVIKNSFTIGLREDNLGNLQHWEELPNHFKGRGLFSGGEIRQIIKGLQTLLGDK